MPEEKSDTLTPEIVVTKEKLSATRNTPPAIATTTSTKTPVAAAPTTKTTTAATPPLKPGILAMTTYTTTIIDHKKTDSTSSMTQKQIRKSA